VLAELVGMAMLLWLVPQALSCERRQLHLRDLFPWRNLGRALGAALVAAVGVVLARAATGTVVAHLHEGLVSRMIPLALAAVLFGLGYLAALFAVGVRPRAVIASLRGRS
jgi:hypothetical protein